MLNVKNPMSSICAKFGAYLINITVISHKTKWPRFLAYPVQAQVAANTGVELQSVCRHKKWDKLQV